jgi:hypothetical protein
MDRQGLRRRYRTGPRTVRDEVYAAKVAEVVSDIRHTLSDHFAKPVEIHAAPSCGISYGRDEPLVRCHHDVLSPHYADRLRITRCDQLVGLAPSPTRIRALILRNRLDLF